jgi:hypothetical protein
LRLIRCHCNDIQCAAVPCCSSDPVPGTIACKVHHEGAPAARRKSQEIPTPIQLLPVSVARASSDLNVCSGVCCCRAPDPRCFVVSLTRASGNDS